MLHVQLPKLLLHLENYKVHHLLPSVQLQTLFTSPKSLHFCINLHPTSPKFPQDDFRNPIPTPLPVQPMQNLTTADERHFITHVLAFFVASDGVVLENLAGLFMKEVQVAEARAFYGFQIAIENIHTEMYSLLLESYIKVSNEKSRVFRALETIPCVEKKANWAIRWIDGSESFAERVIAFSWVEGIFFFGNYKV